MSKPMLNINLNINTNQSPSINTNNNTITNTIINTLINITQPAYLRDVTVTPAVTASSSSLEHALSPHKPPRLTLKVVNGSLSDVRFKARQRWSSIQGNRGGGGEGVVGGQRRDVWLV